ncbi:hypothetical protein KAU88_06475 [Candidatus Bathyarchaeota archaeon]|nr:hypothetical protein [Candidatus Bathyarchaeota archaeon]
MEKAIKPQKLENSEKTRPNIWKKSEAGISNKSPVPNQLDSHAENQFKGNKSKAFNQMTQYLRNHAWFHKLLYAFSTFLRLRRA